MKERLNQPMMTYAEFGFIFGIIVLVVFVATMSYYFGQWQAIQQCYHDQISNIIGGLK